MPRIFLSTLSLRRATCHTVQPYQQCRHFYPRSPCGERPCRRGIVFDGPGISIHALLAESDIQIPYHLRRQKYFYPRSPCGERLQLQPKTLVRQSISIHALLAESDCSIDLMRVVSISFLSTLSLRRATVCVLSYATGQIFLSTLSLRRATHKVGHIWPIIIFLSTLSLRRATGSPHGGIDTVHISIHALLAESDRWLRIFSHPRSYFYPRSPCGERLFGFGHCFRHNTFLSTLSLRRATHISCNERHHVPISIHALLAESDAGCRCGCCSKWLFLSTLSLRRATGAFYEIVNDNNISIHALLAESD